MERKKIETESVMGAGSKKLMPQSEKEEKFEACDQKMEKNSRIKLHEAQSKIE